MKTIIIISLSYLTLMAGCSSSKNVTADDDMQILRAAFDDWRNAPRAGSELPEVGSNLFITVTNWPSGYAPQYVVFRGKKSVSAKVVTSGASDNETVIEAQIIKSSGALMVKSESADVSDRLVYTKNDGARGFIQIGKWVKAAG